MAKDRTLDRHNPDRRAVIWRPNPPDLLARLDAVVPEGGRGKALDDLVTAWLDGNPLPALPAPTAG